MQTIMIKPKGGLYIFGIIFWYIFFMFFLIFESVFLIIDPYENIEITKIILIVVFAYVIPIIAILLVTVDVLKYTIRITNDSVIISVSHNFIEGLTIKYKQTKYQLAGLKSVQQKKGITVLYGYSTHLVMKYENKTRHLDLSRFSKNQISIIQKTVLDRAQVLNGYEVKVLDSADKTWLLN